MNNLIESIAKKISYNETGWGTAMPSHIKYVTENINSLESIFSSNPEMEIEVDKFLDWEENNN